MELCLPGKQVGCGVSWNCTMIRFVAMLVIAVALTAMNISQVYAMGEVPRDMNSIVVDVLTVKGCRVTPPTIEQIKTVSKKLKVPIIINTIYIDSNDEAIEKRFYGSPTVRMDGLDIEPTMRGSKSYGVG
jgi:hypothetical protein